MPNSNMRHGVFNVNIYPIFTAFKILDIFHGTTYNQILVIKCVGNIWYCVCQASSSGQLEMWRGRELGSQLDS
jgi:hypothetical protein